MIFDRNNLYEQMIWYSTLDEINFDRLMITIIRIDTDDRNT